MENEVNIEKHLEINHPEQKLLESEYSYNCFSLESLKHFEHIIFWGTTRYCLFKVKLKIQWWFVKILKILFCLKFNTWTALCCKDVLCFICSRSNVAELKLFLTTLMLPFWLAHYEKKTNKSCEIVDIFKHLSRLFWGSFK